MRHEAQVLVTMASGVCNDETTGNIERRRDGVNVTPMLFCSVRNVVFCETQK